MGRRNKNISKNKICGVFRDSVINGNANPTISSIIESTGLNRKTFYNHFACKDELVAWIFRRDLAETLKANNPDMELLLPPEDPYNFDDLPCYFRNPSSTFSLDQAAFFKSLRETFNANEDYYRVLLKSSMRDAFYSYLIVLFHGLFLQDIDYFLHGRKAPSEAAEFMATFFAEGIVSYFTSSFFTQIDKSFDIYGIAPIDNLIHESMYHLVNAYQNERSASYFTDARNF